MGDPGRERAERTVIHRWIVAAAASTACGLVVATTAVARSRAPQMTMTALPALTTTIANEPLAYPSTPEPVISSYVVTIPPGGVTGWMTHPVPAYLYVLEGTLTVELVDGTRRTFEAGQNLLQCHTTWHRGRNEGTTPMRFLAVFVGAKGVPEILHPPDAK